MANKMYKVVAEELKKEEDMVEPDVELSDREQNDKMFANKLHRNRWFSVLFKTYNTLQERKSNYNIKIK